VPRRSTPERIDVARRAAIRQRLMGEGLTAGTADLWIEAWQARAARDGLVPGSAYWEAAWDWITDERRLRRSP